MSIKRALVPVALVFPLLLYAYDVKDKDDLQPTDSLLHETGASQLSVKQLIVPASLMAYGIFEAAMIHGNRMLNYSIGHEVITRKPAKFRIDDYMQYVPAASVYVLNLAGVKGRYGFKDRTVILGMASLFTAVKVNELKYTVREQRPDKSGRNSFPSGHTAVAFMGAEFLWQEYKEMSPWYGIGGYVIAAGTGALRAWNNKHWVWDVVFGAGLGMLCTKLAYRLYPSVQCKLSKKKEKVSGISFYPYYNGQQGGLSVKYDF